MKQLVRVALVVVALVVTVLGALHSQAPPPAPCPPGCIPDPGAPPVVDVSHALMQIRMSSSMCTATVMGPMLDSGHYEALTAAHCLSLGERCAGKLSDGRTTGWTCVAIDKRADIAWLKSDLPNIGRIATARLATAVPVSRVAIWHKGFGIDRPGNKETGEFIGGPDGNQQLRYFISVSPGDSGGGMFRTDTSEVLSPVCCTMALAKPAYVWGGSPVRAWQLRPSGKPASIPAKLGACPSPPVPHPLDAIVPTLHMATRPIEAMLTPIEGHKEGKGA